MSAAIPSKSKEVPIRAYYDVDGSLTGEDGYNTVNSVFYKSLLTNPEDDYYDATFIDRNKMLKKMTAAFEKQENKKYMMTPAAVEHLKKLLEKPNAEICLVSKNRREYIEALLIYHGIDVDKIKKEQPGKLAIYDIRDLEEISRKRKQNRSQKEKDLPNEKAEIVAHHEDRRPLIGNAVYAVVDDNHMDHTWMMSALRKKRDMSMYAKIIVEAPAIRRKDPEKMDNPMFPGKTWIRKDIVPGQIDFAQTDVLLSKATAKFRTPSSPSSPGSDMRP